MSNWVFNIAKGRFAYYSTLPAAADALIVVLLETAGLEADATLQDHDTLAAVLAGTSNEQTTMGRQTLTGVTVVVDDAGDDAAAHVTVDADDVTWLAAAGNAVSKLLVVYDADTGAGTDTDIIPLMAFDFVITPDGSDITAQVNTSGLAAAFGACP